IRDESELRMLHMLWLIHRVPPTGHDNGWNFKMRTGPEAQHAGFDPPAHGSTPNLEAQASGFRGVAIATPLCHSFDEVLKFDGSGGSKRRGIRSGQRQGENKDPCECGT